MWIEADGIYDNSNTGEVQLYPICFNLEDVADFREETDGWQGENSTFIRFLDDRALNINFPYKKFKRIMESLGSIYILKASTYA